MRDTRDGILRMPGREREAQCVSEIITARYGPLVWQWVTPGHTTLACACHTQSLDSVKS